MTVLDLVPWWVEWLGPLAYVALAAVWLALIPVYVSHRSRVVANAATTWPERAAAAWDARVMNLSGLFLWAPVAVGQAALLLGPFSAVPSAVMIALFGLIAVGLTSYIGWRFLEKDLEQPLPDFRSHVGLSLRRWWPAIALIGWGFLAPARLTSVWMIPWTIIAIGGLVGLRYLAEAWVLSGVAVPGTSRVVAAVEGAAGRFGVTPPRTFVLNTHAANAVALPVRNIVIITQRLVDLLDDDELEAIMLHEIAHLNERRTVTRMRTLGLLAYLPLLGIKPLIGSGVLALGGAVVAVALIAVVVRRVSAHEETRADHAAVEASHEARALGTALLKAHRAALIPTMIKRDPHGPLDERMRRAGVEPDFEPVASKPRLRRLVAAVVVYFAVLVTPLFVTAFRIDIWDGGAGSSVALALGWQAETVLWNNGLLHASTGDYDEAIPYLREAARRGDYDSLRDLPWILGLAGRCGELPAARDALAGAPGVLAADLNDAEYWLAQCEA